MESTYKTAANLHVRFDQTQQPVIKDACRNATSSNEELKSRVQDKAPDYFNTWLVEFTSV